MRIIIALAVMMAWLVATNHCALAAHVAGTPHHGAAAENSHECCSGDQSRPAEESPGTICCAELLKGALKTAAHLTPEAGFSGDALYPEAAPFAPTDVEVAEISPKACGPPGVPSARTILLSRCQPAHAPPA